MGLEIDDEILKLSGILNDEEKSTTLTALLASAIREDNMEYTVDQICGAILASGSVSVLDPLDIIPILLPIKSSSAKDVMIQMCECCSAKEMVIAVQEAVERLQNTFATESEDSQDEDNVLSPVVQLDVLISLYSSSILRLKLRSKSAVETIRPLLSDLESTIRIIPRHTPPSEAQSIIHSVSSTIQIIWDWVRSNPGTGVEDVPRCKIILYSLLDATISACMFSVNSSLAEKTFKTLFPRMICRSAVTPGQEESDKVIEGVKDAIIALGFSLEVLTLEPSMTSLVLFAHNPTSIVASLSWLSSFLPVLIASIQANVALDETITVLFYQLTRTTELPPEIFGPLAGVLPSLASVHPDPQTRFLTFRLLAILLTLAPSPIRFEVLRDLTSESEFPQMRAAAIGLVKEAVLEGIRSPTTIPNIFSSSRFMQTFCPILFRPSPPNLFSKNPTVEGLKDSYEASRLADSLALFYVLLQRDKENRTGVRDATTISTIQRTLLGPLRFFLSSIQTSEDHGHDHGNNLTPATPPALTSLFPVPDDMALVALDMNLERVELTLAALHAEGIITPNS